ncbi:MAG: NIPSNAP family protein [Bacteroidetes bacterium]|nr:NIPSNAP family protein [Bacteroidota bacterium]
MKSYLLALVSITLISLFACGDPNGANSPQVEDNSDNRQFYQLKTYEFSSDQQLATTETYLKDAYLPTLKRQGINQVGVFRFREGDTDSLKKLMVLIPFSSINDFLKLETSVMSDQAHQTAGAAYLDAPHDNKPYERISSVIMKAFVDHPQMATPNLEGGRADRVYELRSYESATEKYYMKKVDMFNAGGEVKLFDRLNFNAVFYGEVLSGDKMPNLMYMTTFPNRTVRDSLWKEFFASPEWTVLKGMEKYKNTVSHADIYFLYPTEYSDY